MRHITCRMPGRDTPSAARVSFRPAVSWQRRASLHVRISPYRMSHTRQSSPAHITKSESDTDAESALDARCRTVIRRSRPCGRVKDMTTQKEPPRRPPARKVGAIVRRHAGPGTDARKQLNSLQVHQVELEMQNTELRKMRAELDASLSRYTALYESAPVGYLTLDRDGSVQQLNQAAATLLGGSPREWRKTRFDAFLVPGARPVFNKLLAAAAEEHGACNGEAELQRPDASTVVAQISAIYHPQSESYLLALSDGTARHDAFKRLREAEHLAQKLLSQNRHLTRRMFEILEEDRRRIVHEMHNELGRRFATVYHEIAKVLQAEHHMTPDTRGNIRIITANLAEMQNGLRRILLRLRPGLLDLAGIGECLREFAANWREQNPGIACELTLEGDVHLVIDDNGEGFDLESVTPGVGLLEMRERIVALDGQFEILSQPGRGV